MVSFGGAKFSGGTVNFGGAEFSGSMVSFGGAKFSGGTVNFGDAEFSGGMVDVSHAANWSVPPIFSRDSPPPTTVVKLPTAAHGQC
jgi:hypothetical protein